MKEVAHSQGVPAHDNDRKVQDGVSEAISEDDVLPLSYSQQQLWFLHRYSPDLTAYNQPRAYRLTGNVDAGALERAFQALIQRHSVLRTRFFERKGVPHQSVLPSIPFSIRREDLSELAAPEQGERLERSIQNVAQHVFDLGAPPLLVARLIKLAEKSYVLVVCLHHIISDAWSNRIIESDLSEAYRQALGQDSDTQLPSLPVQYGDYVLQQQKRVATGDINKELKYWNEHLGDDVPPLEITTDYVYPKQQEFRGATKRFVLDSSLASSLKAFCHQERFTPFVPLFAAWQVVLARYCGQQDFAIGVPSSGRQHEEFQEVVGFFITTLPFRVRVNSAMTLRDVCQQIKKDAVGSLNYADMPLEVLLDHRKVKRDPLRQPLFQVMFGLQFSSDDEQLQLDDVSIELIDLPQTSAKFELSLDMFIEQEQVVGALDFNTDLFEEQTIQRLIDYYQKVLRILLEEPEAQLSSIELPDNTEKALLLDWGSSEATGNPVESVHSLIERQAAETPKATALVFEDQSLNYTELNTRANRLAHYLIGLGVKPETRVGIAVERSIEMVVGLLAILKAGGAYVPLDPDYPSDRMAYMVEDSGIELLLTQQHLRDSLPVADGLNVIDLDRLGVAHHAPTNPNVALHGENLAYVIYTSGSTGRPKGAANRHHALTNRLQWMQGAYGLMTDDAVLQKTPFSFDVSVWEFFWPLMQGARLVMAPPGAHREPAQLVELIRSHNITTLHFVPSMLQAFLAYGKVEDCTSLTRLVCSGEALPAELQNQVLARLPHTGLYNLYGPTEAAIDVTHWTCQDDGRNQVAIGQPIAGIRTYVLDGDLNLAPPGVAGELYLGGVGLARGYLHRPDLTAERFVADLFAQGERLYRTGDLVRWREDGQLEYLGRLDHQVKIRGLRIELGEIEAELLFQPEVRESVVVAQEGPSGSRLVAYVVPQADSKLDTSSLREALGQKLPDYMVPGVVVTLDELPLNANGKVDRKALPAPDLVSGSEYEPPQGEVEEALAEIWSEILGVERVGRHDNFFELGGHSLLALKVLEKMRHRGLMAQVRTLFQHPELTAFAQALIQTPEQAEINIPPNLIPHDCQALLPEMMTLIELNAEELREIEAAVPSGASNIQDIYPLAPLQEGILFHHRLQEEGDAYVTPRLLGFDSRERLEAFIAGFNKLIARHDILRTAVLWEGLREPVQVVCRHAELVLEWLDLDGDPSQSVAEQLSVEVDPRYHRLDVRRAPMFRAVAAYDAEKERWLLQLPSHHLVMDHTTLELLVEEIALIQQGRADELPKPLPFRNFVAQARLGVSLEEHEAFFRERLGDVEEPTAPFGLLDVRGDGSDIEEVRVPLTAELAQQVRQQAQRYGVSTASLFHLAWALVLSKTTGRNDVVFGTVLFGRMQGIEGAERALGMFINTLPVRIKMGAKEADTCLRQTHDALSELIRHEHANLGLAQRCSGLPGGVPLFTSLLNYRYSSPQQEGKTAHSWEGMEVLGGQERTNYPVTMSVDDLGSGFQLVGQVSRTIGAQRLCDYLGTAIAGIVENLQAAPQRAMSEIKLLGVDEWQLLSEWGGGTGQFPDALPIHRLIERQAVVNPMAKALVFEDKSLSYAELNARANRLAHHLIGLGVKPETRVGIAVERSLDMVVGLLGILKAGGAYVPLDPDYPSERLAYIVQDSGIELLLTQSRLMAKLPQRDWLTTIALDSLNVAEQPASSPDVVLNSNNLAYVIYTSGSTGQPKGVQLCHANVARLLDATAGWFDFSEQDTWTLFHSYAFDFSVWEIFGALCTGGKLVVVPFWVSRSPEEFLELICREQVTVLNQTPSAFRQLVNVPGIQTRKDLALRFVIFGGEALEPAMLRPWIECFGDTHPRLINMYGITETTVHVTYCPITAADLHGQLSPVGVAIPDLGIEVLDDDLNRLPIGVDGELYVSGAGLARGYHKRFGLSSERFIANPFDSEGGRLYRTGDLGRWRSDGQLEYLGRGDQQVKIRGFRIELGEIESCLLAQPEIRDAVVVACSGPGGDRLVGYMVAAVAEVDPQVLRKRLSQHLPDHMIPSALVAMDALPLTANGKLDRAALPDPDIGVGNGEFEAPCGEWEVSLAALWCEVLEVERVSRHDNFFELGGHSLLALRLIARLRERGRDIAIRELFEHPRLSDFAQVLKAANNLHKVDVPPNLIPEYCETIEPWMLPLVLLDRESIARIESTVSGGGANIQDIYPLAPLQEGILFHHLLHAERDAYITAYTMRFDDRARMESFIDGFNQVMVRHDILRTAIFWEGLDEPVQVVLRQAPLVVEWLEKNTDDIEDSMLSPLERLRYRADPGRCRIDVRQAPLMRAVVIEDTTDGGCLLQLLIHHLIDDNMTVKQAAKEIALIEEGRSAELPEPVPFRSFIAQARLGVPDSEHQDYFSRCLGDLDEGTLPFGLDDVLGDGDDIDEQRLVIGGELATAVHHQARLQGVSVAAFFHLAWSLVIAKATGKDDVVFGTVLSGRMQGVAGAEQALGVFINTLPLRIKLGTQSVDECLRQTHAALSELLHHEHANLGLAQRCSGLPSGTPLFSSLLNYRLSATEREGSVSHAWKGMESLGGQERTNYPITMSVDDLGNGFQLVGQVSRIIGAQRLCDYLSAAIAGIVENLQAGPQQPLSEISLLRTDEQQLLSEWGGNTQRYPDTPPTQHLIERQAALTPMATALVFEDQLLSYAELNIRANRLAHYLIGLGVRPETRVGIAVERSIEMVVGLLGILKAGGAYVPLDPGYPTERLAYMVKDSGIELLLTQQHLRDTLPVAESLKVIELDPLEIAHHASSNPEVVLHGEHLAYVVYTSGSTGRPKGVGVSHGPLSMHLQAIGARYGLTPEDRLLQFASISFDAAGEQWLLPLLVGAALVLPQGRHLGAETLATLVRQHAVSVLYLPPAYLRHLYQSLPAGSLSVRLCIAGGEAWSREDFEGIRRACQPERLFNAYGPAETVISPTLWSGDAGLGQSFQVPIGQPVGARKALVLDAGLNLVPVGIAGELYLGGTGLARGYLHRPDLTTERFIADPFTEGERLYRTGDLVRWREDGQLEYLGRLDHQVKIRGLRIELGEIEAELLAQPAVREAVVVAQEIPSGSRLVAYVVPQADCELDSTSLRESLGQRLPDYMVPGVVVTLDALPLNPNGKVDRKALPEPDLASGSQYEPPQGEMEEALAEIWSDVLGVEQVGRHDNFFELGGHSLLALKVLEKMRHRGMTAMVRTLFQYPELVAFVQALTQAPEQAEITIPPSLIPYDCQALQPEMLTLIELSAEELCEIETVVPGGASNIQDIYPLAPLQEGILFHHRLQEEGDAYVTPRLLGFDSRESLKAFITGFNKLIARHDILRTAVLWEGLREPVQVVYRHAMLDIEWPTAPDVDTGGVAEWLYTQVDPEHHRLDVRQAPMIRALAAHDAEQGRWLLQLPSHHLVMDHTTLELLVEEISLIQKGREDELPEPIPFRNFVAQTRLGVSQEEHEVFFREQLGDVEEPTAPFGLLDVRGDGSEIEELRLPLPAELAQQVRQQAQRYGVSTASLFHLAWALVLSKTTGRDDVVFGSVLFGRMQGIEGAERALGMFINTLPVRIKMGTQGVDQSLRQTHNALSELLHHEHASLGLAQRCSGLPSGMPLFTSLLNYRYSAPKHEGSPVHTWEGMEMLGAQERTNYPLGMAVDDLGEGFQLVGQASRTIGAQRLCDYMEAAVVGIVKSLQTAPQQAPSEISLLGTNEQQLLSAWGVNSHQHPDAQPIYQLVERRAAVTPEAAALVFEDQLLSYAELNTRANQLAHYLIGLGVKPETRVGIAVERSIEMVVGLLAILKAGGAYVPLDPEYPTERLAFITEDSGIALLLTQHHLRELLPVADCLSVVELDRLDVSHHASTDPVVALHGEHLAYVIYTSGSTGRPKGAAIRHDSLTNCIVWMQETYQLTDTDAVLHKAPFGFDVSVWEIFWPLSVGARLVVAQPGDHRDPERIIELIQQHGVTTLNFVPSMLKAFLAYPDVKAKTKLKHIMCGGEAVPATLQQDVAECLNGTHLHDLYGPTETTIHVTHWWCRDDAHRQIPIGRPISGTRTYVLDGELNLAPPGVAGELYLGGVSLARGYLNRSDLTAERFIADPFTEGERLYRTGDLVRWREDGQLEYLGRLDLQVKIRGLRIELGEIEVELLSQPEIREAVVVAQESPSGSRLVAYVVPRADIELDTSKLRDRLGQQLPDYMVPGAVVTLDTLPLNANGKVDRKALPEPDLSSSSEYEPPQGEVEEALAEIWSEILSVEQVGRHDNFFELGGHSLLAVQMVACVQADMQVELKISEVFKHPLLRDLAKCIVALNSEYSFEQSLSDIDSFIDSMDTVQ